MTKAEERKFKTDFRDYFIEQMREEAFIHFFYNVFTIGTAYIVGGYARDYLNRKRSRDIDIIVDIKNRDLVRIINENNLSHKVNRHGGVKVKLRSMEADVWSLEDNWAFRNNLVKVNEEDVLNSIAKGCFYNYDALVVNINSFNFNFRYYKEFVERKELNILQERSIYKNLNPSIEANILRAFYIKSNFDIRYTQNTAKYLISKIGVLTDEYGDVINRLIEIREGYPKYKMLHRQLIEKCIRELRDAYSPLTFLFWPPG